ncbi:MAG: hypothetical protein ACQEP3_02475 [Patescibacteria group bacterium]
MSEGIFQKVKIDSDRLKVNKDVSGFHFEVHRLGDSSKIVLELCIHKKEDRDGIRIEFEKLLPDWVLQKIQLDLATVILISSSEETEDLVECMLSEAIDQFEELLSLEIGEERDGIYFTVRFSDQRVSVWDRVLSVESVKGFIDVREEGGTSL